MKSLVSHSSGRVHQRPGVREVARARRRGHVAKFGGRSGVRRRAKTQSRDARGVRGLAAGSPAILATGPRKNSFVKKRINKPNC